jgi:hypothetical protein
MRQEEGNVYETTGRTAITVSAHQATLDCLEITGSGERTSSGTAVGPVEGALEGMGAGAAEGSAETNRTIRANVGAVYFDGIGRGTTVIRALEPNTQWTEDHTINPESRSPKMSPHFCPRSLDSVVREFSKLSASSHVNCRTSAQCRSRLLVNAS